MDGECYISLMPFSRQLTNSYQRFQQL